MTYYIIKMQDKNYINILTNAEKAFDKIQHLFMIKKKKNSRKPAQREHTPQHNKDHIQQTQS